MNLAPYLPELPPWEQFLQTKHVLIDADALITIRLYEAEVLLERMKEIEVTICSIHPVYVEISNTNSKVERINRQLLFSKYIELLPLSEKDYKLAEDIQVWLSQQKIFTASPTDLYLGGKLAFYRHNNIFLLTGNISDFPYPLFERVSGIILQKFNQSKLLHLLKFNHSFLQSSANSQ